MNDVSADRVRVALDALEGRAAALRDEQPNGWISVVIADAIEAAAKDVRQALDVVAPAEPDIPPISTF